MHGREVTDITMDGARTDFDNSTIGVDAPSPSEGLDPNADPLGTRRAAKERAQNYSAMTNEQINTAYDELRKTDPLKVKEEGMNAQSNLW